MKNHWLKYREWWAIVEHQDGTRTYPRPIEQQMRWKVANLDIDALCSSYVDKNRRPKYVKVFNGHCEHVYTHEICNYPDWQDITEIMVIFCLEDTTHNKAPFVCGAGNTKNI
tara:strand:- start:160 stop:495 length:336 start_codon:yes stop_codon:yes gene_type:complete